MKHLLAASAVALASLTTVPAFAEPYHGGDRYEHGAAYNERGGYGGGHGGGYGHGGYTRERLERLERRIDRRVHSGQLDRREARRLYAQLGELRDLARYYHRDGISWREQRDLDYRLDRLSQQVRWERHDHDYRGDGYGPYRR